MKNDCKKEKALQRAVLSDDFDKSLFELPIGVAMINASNDIKNLAKYVTKKDNNHNGVVLFVKDYIKNN